MSNLKISRKSNTNERHTATHQFCCTANQQQCQVLKIKNECYVHTDAVIKTIT